ncbi:MAG: SRPBCC family protein [Alphaproteobacteria bacterium]
MARPADIAYRRSAVSKSGRKLKMRSITVKRRISAAPAAVWAVLADFPNIAAWNSSVTKSFSTSESTSGVGAQRHYDLAPFGALEETVKEWEEERRLVVNIDSAKKLPMSRGAATFLLNAAGDGATEVANQPKFGVIGQLLGSIALDGQFTKGFTAFLKDFDTASTQ